jgi:3-oxoacyl-(acyl-carrier-protein) synthase
MNADPVVVVGMGLMTPQASSPQEYWRLLLNGDSEFGYIQRPPRAAEQSPARDCSMTARWLRHCLIQATHGLDLRTTAGTLFVVGAMPAGIPELEDQIVRHGFGLHGRPVIGDRSRPLNGQLPHRIARDAAAGILHQQADILVVDTACSAALCAIDVAMQALRRGRMT